MTESHSAQFIQFACKQCGKVFTRVPYESIARYGIAECSACKSRFTLDKEELQAALLDAQNDLLTKAAQMQTTSSEGMFADDLTIEKNQELDADGNLDIEENQELDANDNLDIEENKELDADGNLDIEENQELDANDNLDIEENKELDADGNLDIEENQELDADGNLDIEENRELDAAGNLDIEENKELDADDNQTYEKEVSHTDNTERTPCVEPSGFTDTCDDEQQPSQQTITHSDNPPAPATMAGKAGFEPEKEDKVAFARRLSHLIPEGWINQSQDFNTKSPSDSVSTDSSNSDLKQLEGQHQFLVFAIETTEFAVPVENTTEIAMVPERTQLPHVPDWLMGIINLRGDIVSMIDIKNFLGMGPFDMGSHDRIILLRSLQEDLCTAIIVNRISGMEYVADEDIITTDSGQQGTEKHICGMFEVDGRSIAILDIENMLISDDIQQFHAM